jgi:hypothetical protein
MVDIFKSAIDAAFGAGSSARISNNIGFGGGATTTGSGGVRSDFTGQIVDVGNIRLRVGNQIAEGYLIFPKKKTLFTNFVFFFRRLCFSFYCE